MSEVSTGRPYFGWSPTTPKSPIIPSHCDPRCNTSFTSSQSAICGGLIQLRRLGKVGTNGLIAPAFWKILCLPENNLRTKTGKPSDSRVSAGYQYSHLCQQGVAPHKEWFIHLRFPSYEHTKIKNGILEEWERKKIADIYETIGGALLRPKFRSIGTVILHDWPFRCD